MKDSSQPFSLNSVGSVKGWIFNLYPEKPGQIAVWIKKENGECQKLVDKWSPSFYVSAPSMLDLSKLGWYLPKNEVSAEYEYVEKYASLQAQKRTKVLKVTVPDDASLRFLANHIWRLGEYGKYRLWNVDIPLPQMYLFDRDLFPMAYVEAAANDGNVSWKLMDSAENVDYQVPLLKTVHVTVELNQKGATPRFSDPIADIQVKFDKEKVTVDRGDEAEKILALVETIQKTDPDIIITDGGDSFIFSYLARRALVNGVLSNLVLGREKAGVETVQKKGTTYFSYGRVYYRAAPQRLLGRLHIDLENCGLYVHYGLEGLIEVSRTCRMPLQMTSRVTIGTTMKSVQLYQAIKDGFIIPWKKSEPENFKNGMDLLVADRGGFYFEPKLGIHDNIGELDFSSMYPMLMLQKNISPETVGCKCCPDSKNRVPEIGFNICEKRRGLIPKVLELLLRKRLYYKKMRNEATDPETRRKYDQRQAAYKIILCTCFGYLGYRNARFGKVDAHNAACAFARKTLLDTAKLVEKRGFEIVHGIVDSLYIKKAGATDKDFIDLCREITEATALPISFEGRYRWIVFLSSKTHFGVPVLNRFYGVFQDGKVKARGIEIRRRDTPRIVSRFQNDVLQELAKARNSEEFYQQIPNAFNILKKYAAMILDRKVDLEDLMIEKHLSKDPCDYITNAHQAIAARQLCRHGVDVTAGQTIKYIILDADNKHPERRVKASQLIDVKTNCDTQKYLYALEDALLNILAPFIHKNCFTIQVRSEIKQWLNQKTNISSNIRK